MLTQRIIGAAIILAVLALPLYFGGLIFGLLVVLIAALAVYEFGRLFHGQPYEPLYLASIGLTALIVLDGTLRLGLIGPGIVLAVLGSITWLIFKADDLPAAPLKWAVTVVGPFYLGWTLNHLVLLRGLPDGLLWILLALLGTWAADIGAYFAGRQFGRHKLYPRISPGKTWEGVVGGAAFAVIVLTAVLVFAPGQGWLGQASNAVPLWVHGIVLGLLVTGAAVLGDLAESLLKRSTGVKDAGQLIPGHGGLLDRVDSLVFTGPVVYYYIIYIIGLVM